MFFVELILERIFFRLGVEVLVVGRFSLGVEELGLVDVGFLFNEGVLEGREGVGVGLILLGVIFVGGVVLGIVVFFFMELVEVFFERFKLVVKVGVRDNKGLWGESKREFYSYRRGRGLN